MCGPYGHGYVTETPLKSSQLDLLSGANRDDDEELGGGSVATLPDKPKSPKDGKKRLTAEELKAVRSAAAKKGWETRRLNKGKGKTQAMLLPSGRLYFPAYMPLNSHHEIRFDLGLSLTHELVPTGITLDDGRLALQRNRGHNNLPVSDDDVQSIEQDWIEQMSGGNFLDFFYMHAGRLSDWAEWTDVFPSLLDLNYVLSLCRSPLERERYGKMVALQIEQKEIEGFRIPDVRESKLFMWHRDSKHLKAVNRIKYDHRTLLRKLQRQLVKLKNRCCGRTKTDAVKTLEKYPNSLIGILS
jgi:hypothetical protein